MTRTVLVTGASGYVGGRLARALALDPEVRLRLGSRQPRASAVPVPAEVVQLDLASEASVEQACRGVDSVVHLAALNHAECEARPEEAWLVNTLGTQRLARAAAAAGVERFVYLSTAHVYGSPLQGVISESSPTRPASLYAMTHRAAEDIVLAAHARQAFSGVALRLSNALGAPADLRANAWMLIANDLCRQAVTTGRLTLRSSGLQVRDFVPMSDVLRAIQHVSSLPRAQLGDGLFNMSGERPLRIIDLAERVADRCAHVLGAKPEILRPEPRPDEPSLALEICMDRLRATGYVPGGGLDAEIDATLALCKKAFGA